MEDLENNQAPSFGRDGRFAAPVNELRSLGTDIIRFFHTQTFTPGIYTTNEEVCQAFSDILLRHWELGLVSIFMRDGAGRPLQQFHVHLADELEPEKARAAAALLADVVEQAGEEQQVWLERETFAGAGRASSDLRHAFMEIGFSAGVGVPIYARGTDPVGILVVMVVLSAQLTRALDGIRLIAEPLVIAVGNARRVKAIHEQRRQIEQLVEELKQSNGALKDANQELQRVSVYRSLFLARMSHELRTPLTSILGFAEILLDQEHLTETQRRFCEKIQSSGLTLQTSLKQLVDLSRLEAGRTEMFLHEFSLRETLRESCAAVAPLARKREVQLNCQSALDLPSIVSDEGKLRQVFYNFLAHAIGRSASGEQVSVHAARPEPNRFIITISDGGDVIKDVSTVFEAMDALEPGAAGTNLNELGLSIARRLVDALGGAVRLKNGERRGLVVQIDLPASPPEEGV